jgi:hypothetical protein
MTTTKPTIAELNCETNETIYREMTDEEFADHKAFVEQASLREEERKIEQARIEALKVSARAKLVAQEPLTEEEAALLVI